MIYARNAQKPQPKVGYVEQFTYLLPKKFYAFKLAVVVRSEEDSEGTLLNGPVMLQVTESDEHVFENQTLTEQYCELGFYSKAFATPITGWRIKVPEGLLLPGLVDMVAYG